jgi:hypothetical protein
MQSYLGSSFDIHVTSRDGSFAYIYASLLLSIRYVRRCILEQNLPLEARSVLLFELPGLIKLC